MHFFKVQVQNRTNMLENDEREESIFRSRLHNRDVRKQLTECLRAGVIEAGAPCMLVTNKPNRL